MKKWTRFSESTHQNTPISQRINPFNDANNDLCTTDNEMCSAFSDYFCSVFNAPNSTNNASSLSFDSAPKSPIINFTPQIVEQSLRKVKNDTCAGVDNVPNIFLRKLSGLLSVPFQQFLTFL